MDYTKLGSAFNILKNKFPDYEDRPQQMEMANDVFACLQDKGRLIAEAGTGVGKSFAYLIPAILSEEKTIVSTATLALQSQLIEKDLVFLQDALPHEFSFAMLKGKNNYLCPKREREFAEIGEGYKRFREWTDKTNTGDKDELSFVPDFWSRVCGDSADCNGRDCPFFNDCFYYRHFRELRKNDILVVNHYLLVYDLLSEFSILPFHKQLIIDEAHSIEDIISHVFGTSLANSRVVWLLHRLRGLKIEVDHLYGHVDAFFKTLDMPSQTIYPIPDVVIGGLKHLRELFALDNIIMRLEANKGHSVTDELRDKIDTTIICVKSLAMDIDDFIKQDDNGKVYYLTWNKKGIELKSNLVESIKPFNELIKAYDSVIMTSATLRGGGDLTFLKERLGIIGFQEKTIGSPFDYKKQSLLYIDKRLPAPVKENTQVFQKESIKVIEDLINASRGRALVLFTSYSHLRFASENLRTDYPFKSQGDMPPARLIEWFKNTPNSVLLATATFWQGIDIKGEKLSLVVIVKMPFGSPGDPVYDERCRRLGSRWFQDLALPSAILTLRQGFGRLIRSSDDYGVVAILDTRLITSSYGNAIISSLPEADKAHSIEDVQRFFDNIPVPVPQERIYNKNEKETNKTKKDKGISMVAALGNSNDPSVIPELIAFTKSRNGNERRLAASALGKLARFKPEIYKAVEPLDALVGDKKPQVRQYAMKALARIGRLNRARLDAIINDPDEKGYNVSMAKRLINRL